MSSMMLGAQPWWLNQSGTLPLADDPLHHPHTIGEPDYHHLAVAAAQVMPSLAMNSLVLPARATMTSISAVLLHPPHAR